ncbi:MAG: hypothetical protein KDE50_00885 [Caldilineaceae bacterium]|nr:hypothetical protein [Caldilineaceae bacterium]MCB0138441.1 hypothetical protein [Caldilineaceae bacterium]
MPKLEADRLYALDGGIFRAKYIAEKDHFELWTYLGREGYVVARTGFEIGEHGGLYDRIYDIEAQHHIVLDFPRFTLADLQEVTPEQAAAWNSTLSEEELYQRWPELRGRINLDESDEQKG